MSAPHIDVHLRDGTHLYSYEGPPPAPHSTIKVVHHDDGRVELLHVLGVTYCIEPRADRKARPGQRQLANLAGIQVTVEPSIYNKQPEAPAPEAAP